MSRGAYNTHIPGVLSLSTLQLRPSVIPVLIAIRRSVPLRDGWVSGQLAGRSKRAVPSRDSAAMHLHGEKLHCKYLTRHDRAAPIDALEEELSPLGASPRSV